MQISFNTTLSLCWFINLIFSPFSPPFLVMIPFNWLQMDFVNCFIQISWSGNDVLCNSCMGARQPHRPSPVTQHQVLFWSRAPYEVLSLSDEISDLYSCIPRLTSLVLRALGCFHSHAWHQDELFQIAEPFELFNIWKQITEIKAFLLEEPTWSLSFLVRATMIVLT